MPLKLVLFEVGELCQTAWKLLCTTRMIAVIICIIMLSQSKCQMNPDDTFWPHQRAKLCRRCWTGTLGFRRSEAHRRVRGSRCRATCYPPHWRSAGGCWLLVSFPRFWKILSHLIPKNWPQVLNLPFFSHETLADSSHCWVPRMLFGPRLPRGVPHVDRARRPHWFSLWWGYTSSPH